MDKEYYGTLVGQVGPPKQASFWASTGAYCPSSLCAGRWPGARMGHLGEAARECAGRRRTAMVEGAELQKVLKIALTQL